MTPGALATELHRRDAPGLRPDDLRRSAPRSMVKKWIAGGFATSDSAFNTGQILGQRVDAIDGLHALYASGHYGAFVALALTLVDHALKRFTVTEWAVEEAVAAQYALDYALNSLAAMPLLFSEFDGYEAGRVEEKMLASIKSSLKRAASDDGHLARGVFLGSLDDAWASRGSRVREWTKLFEWASTQSSDYRESSLLAWTAVVEAVSLRARDSDNPVHERRRVQADWFNRYRQVLQDGRRVTRDAITVRD